METISSIGIRADGAGRERVIMLTETNYRVWASMTEQSLKEKRLWGHVVRTVLLPPPARVVSAAVTGTPAVPGSDAVNAIPAITRAMVDHDVKLIEDFHAAAARASYTLMQTLSQKDISAVMMLPDAADKWDKLANDYAAVSSSQSTNARSKFNNFRIRDGESVIETQHRFDDLVNECSIQAINLSDEEKTAALLMRPCSKWINFMDVYATMEPPPSSAAIFRAMKSQEERMITRNEKEYEEANFNGISGSRATQPEWKRRPKIDVKRPSTETRSCYCCGEVGHLSAICKSKNETCEFCQKRGHLTKACRVRLATEEPEDETEEVAEKQERSRTLLWPQAKPRLSFATKKEKARTDEGMYFTVISPATLGFKVAEGAGQSWGTTKQQRIRERAQHIRGFIDTGDIMRAESKNLEGDEIMENPASSGEFSMESPIYSDASNNTASDDCITAK